ncbi:ribosomal-protein-alanine acetyltransferase [Desulfofarcimen acetoxidans DSM 771]|jgi:ribosomal-protein-alanine N-acetyltransferase|uniref:[Ribosomal protein bS18]-alanine N-acetyltransferase n=1 Tax=Desulfofarcimen acetoxidans (strain ATCC 49208 / DSM 771 / KCTC 5769 / VKM B-1644 / 5575) TaxID=485916 RepID=C8VWT1_DESAS|nr:ribosomal protein S18-alanine N-acetyltransferase [Desulfofarcimen acetoxidans]ACV64445.1 ribosomal-protein-alanine acetyltransferase [Desulfofarcimen acetoxidans DSM 771]
MNIEFEKMNAAHLTSVTAIENSSFITPWSYQSFVYELSQNSFAYYIVALLKNEVVGYAGMWIILDEAHITNVAVHPEHRGRKIGYALMQQMLIRAALRGATKMTLEVRSTNEPAKKLYNLLGFKESGIRKGYYEDTGEDALIMWKEDLF